MINLQKKQKRKPQKTQKQNKKATYYGGFFIF